MVVQKLIFHHKDTKTPRKYMILFHEKSDTDVNPESFALSKFYNCELQIVNWYDTLKDWICVVTRIFK
ncbi:hypothetical protein CBF18_16130 [Mastigocladus laminosus WC112]|nr:hypothetical protein CBF18_16130 [Mastigocladus laminosus WC112]